MNQPKYKVLGIGAFARNCTAEIDCLRLPEVKTMETHHFSEFDLHEICEFLSGGPATKIIIADLGATIRDSLALSAINLSKKTGEITLCILTTPYIFEGKKAIHMALATASHIQPISDACLILRKDVPQDSKFCISHIDNRIGNHINASTIVNMVRDLVELTTSSGATDISKEDIKEALRDKGTFIITRGKGSGEKRVSDALEAALSSPLMSKCDLYSSHNIILKLLVSDETDLSTEELSVLFQFLERMPSHADVKWGITKSDTLQADVELILLASGFDVKLPGNS